jgi:hypothetical protein
VDECILEVALGIVLPGVFPILLGNSEKVLERFRFVIKIVQSSF